MAPSLRNHVSRRAKEDWEVEQSMKKAEAVDARVAAHHGAEGATTGAGGGDKGRGRGGRGRGGRTPGLPPPVQS
eukprot:8942586-Pyramimonas_sp.AAC.1